MTIEYEVLTIFKPFLLGYCNCGCGGVTNFYRGRPRQFIIGHHGKGKVGINAYAWKGGRHQIGDYWNLLLPEYFGADSRGYILEHVYNFQEFNKCCLLPWGQVHHIIPVNKGGSNMPWNLEGVTAKQHQLIHHKKDMSNRRCSKCGSSKTYKEQSTNGTWYFHWYKDSNNGWLCKKCFIYQKLKKTNI